MDTVSIQTVSRRTGLSAHAIRAWERRYRAIEPARSPGRHRMYSEVEVERLKLLANAVRGGRLISRLVHLDNAELRLLGSFNSSDSKGVSALEGGSEAHEGPEPLRLDDGLAAVENFDTKALENFFQKAQIKLGDQGLLRNVLAPMARQVGDRWRSGALTAAQEHFFTMIAKLFAWNLTRQYHLDSRAPKIVVGTPAGQIHDLGAVIVAATAANAGWRVALVGANLPAFELAGAVQSFGACALALSIVYPDDDPLLSHELAVLGRLLPEHVRVFAGGRSAGFYAPSLEALGAKLLGSLEELDTELDAMRRRPRHS